MTDPTFLERYGAWAVIAGASDGVGASYARAMGERGLNVVLIARRRALLDELADEIATTSNVDVRAVVIDLATPDAADRVIEATEGLEVGMLMYNAGADPFAQPFLTYDVEPQLAMIHRNCVVPTRLCHHFGAEMKERGRGGIVLVTSGAAIVGMTGMATYGGSKAYDLVFAEALWAELHGAGVDVLAPILGATDTPALRRMMVKWGLWESEDDDSPLPDAVTADWVANGIIANLDAGPSWYAGDASRTGGEGLRSLPRNDAVRAALAHTSAYSDSSQASS